MIPLASFRLVPNKSTYRIGRRGQQVAYSTSLVVLPDLRMSYEVHWVLFSMEKFADTCPNIRLGRGALPYWNKI